MNLLVLPAGNADAFVEPLHVSSLLVELATKM